MLNALRRSFSGMWNARRKVLAALILLAAALGAAQPVWSQGVKHPLDALSWRELWTTYEVIHAAGKSDDKTRYAFIHLKEPPKEEVLEWKPGKPMRREAFAVLKQETRLFEAVVDLNAKKLISWTEIKGVQPPMWRDEAVGAVDDIVKQDPEMQAALKKRGLTDFNIVFCGAYGKGFYASPDENGRRLLRAECFEISDALEGYGRPIEGLTALVDTDAKKVVRVMDTEVVPVPQESGNYDVDSAGPLREPLKSMTVEQPMGPAFRLDGQTVTWDKWKFHFRIDRRVGLVVTNVGYQDGDKLRSILYEGSLSEIFVPYMDAGEDWFARTFFDAGEFAGFFVSSLDTAGDCPENAVYFDQIFSDAKGIPQITPRGACLFEQPTGYMAWRHDQGGVIESRKARELVLRSIANAGNYDYVFDWVFQQDGVIRVRVGATGQDEVKAVKSRTAAEDKDGQDGMYGRFVADNIVGVDHDHFFSFRLDFDVDGTQNTFVRDKLVVKELPGDSLRKSLWVVQPEIAKTEQQAETSMSMSQPEYWRIINPNVKSPLGYPVGYELMGGENAMSLLSPGDFPQKRAGFTDHQVWVTPYRDNERYAAGDYPMQSKGGDGLPAWTKANRPIENTDIVLWYTMGFHHIPHAEDWPVMPTMWHEFELRPVNFFARSPALDLPKQ